MKRIYILLALVVDGCAHLPPVQAADVSKISKNSYIIDNGVFQHHVKNPVGLAKVVKVATVRDKKTKKVLGYRFKKIEKGSIIDAIGFKVGDMMYEVNGKKLDSMESVWKAYEELKTKTKFTVKFIRKIGKKKRRMASKFSLGTKVATAKKVTVNKKQ